MKKELKVIGIAVIVIIIFSFFASLINYCFKLHVTPFEMISIYVLLCLIRHETEKGE